MRAFAGSSLLLAFCLATAGFAQTFGSQSGFGNVVFPGTGRAPHNPNVTGFGNVVFPGTPKAPHINPFSVTDLGFAGRLAGTVNPFFRPGSRIGGFKHGVGGGVPFAPYAYPVYVGGGGGYYEPPVQQQPNVVVIYPQQQPPVVINQMLGGPAQEPQIQDISAGVESYQAPARETASNPTAEPSSYYLIAFKDNSIYSALAYWIEGETLHYVTAGNNHNQVSLSLVDRPLTERLNRERRVGVHPQGK
jgi:hypothetical protein